MRSVGGAPNVGKCMEAGRGSMACQAVSSILPSRTMDPSIRGTTYGASPGLAEKSCWAPAGRTVIRQTKANTPTRAIVAIGAHG